MVVPELFAANRLRRAAIYVAGGPIASLLGMVGGYLLWLFVLKSDLLATWIIVSAVLVLVTWLPFRIRHGQLNLASDAWQLIDMARGQRKARLQPSGATLGNLSAVSELLRRAGCPTDADYYQLLAGLPRCELCDYGIVDESRRLCEQLPDGRFPEARQVLQLIEAAALVGTDDPRAGGFLDAALAASAATPDLYYALFVLSYYQKLQRGEPVGEELQTRLEEARREKRPDRACMLEILAFHADPPQDAAVACQTLLSRHRQYVTETQRAQLLSFMTELLVEREEHVAGREHYQAALAAIATVSQSIQVPEVRRQYILAASLPLQRAMLASNDDLPLFINDQTTTRPQVVARFSKLSLNLGWASIGFVVGAYIAKAALGRPLPSGLIFMFTLVTLVCLLGATLSSLVAVVRKEHRLVQGLVGVILGIVAMVLLVGLLPKGEHPRQHLPPEFYQELEVGPEDGETGPDSASE